MLAALESIVCDTKSIPCCWKNTWLIHVQKLAHLQIRRSDINVKNGCFSAKTTRSKTIGEDRQLIFRLVYIDAWQLQTSRGTHGGRLKTRSGPLLRPLFGRNGAFGKFGCQSKRCIDRSCMLFQPCVFRIELLAKVYIANMRVFFSFSIVFSSICGTFKNKTKWTPKPMFRVFGKRKWPAAFFTIKVKGKREGGERTSGKQVLSVSVQRVVECQMRDTDLFCSVSFSGTIRSAMSALLEKNSFLAATQAFSLRTSRIANFPEHPTTSCPRPVTHAGQEFRQFCARNTVVETRLCHATLSCSGHKPAWKRV